jgi:holliday junction DNA helicase RuvA
MSMIANLKGTIEETGLDSLVIDVNGVGYLVFCSAKTLSAVGTVGEFATVHTEMQVSENDQRLMGFASKEERDWFRLLTGVQGVGGKVALAILSALEPADIHRAVASGDKVPVTRANGVGPKLAERIVRELKDKVGGMAVPAGGLGLSSVGAGARVGAGNHAADALSALTNLGFRPADASVAVAGAVEELGEDASLDALVRLALKKVGR